MKKSELFKGATSSHKTSNYSTEQPPQRCTILDAQILHMDVFRSIVSYCQSWAIF
jgi:hypothetical protein